MKVIAAVVCTAMAFSICTAAVTAETKQDAKPVVAADKKPDAKPVVVADTKLEAKPVIAAEKKAEAKPAVVAEKKTDAKPATEAETKPEVKPAVPQEITLSDLPGITTPDKTPNACVNCHANHPEMKFDGRLTKTLAKWHVSGADPKILAKAQAAAPAGKTLTGKHPDVSALVKVLPDDCLMCHNRDSRAVPPFAKMLHAIHLVGGKENHFLSKVHGTCTNCHKLDEKTGTWRVGSGEEKL